MFLFLIYIEIGPKIVTTNQHKLLDELKRIEIKGGGDCPEHAIGGILSALESALPKSFVYVFTDAVAKDYKLDERVIKLIEKKQTPITFFLTGFCRSKNTPEYLVFQKIASLSNGEVFDLKKKDIRDVIKSIGTLLDKNQVPVIAVDSDNAGNTTISVDVDKNLKDLTVSVAGSQPNITITNPRNETYSTGEDLVNLENMKVIKVDQPEPGLWNIQASSSSSHSVRLSGISDITFSYGFSLEIPNKTNGISYRPLLDSKNILIITPSNSDLIHNITITTIKQYVNANANGNEFQFDLPLRKEVIDGKDTYLTEPFDPPRQQFKISVSELKIKYIIVRS